MNSWNLRERARETLSKEVGYVTKPHGDRLRVALAFPNTYWVGMSNLGFQTIYRLFNAEDDIVCERFFLPPKQELAELLATNTRIVTLESQTPVSDFDVIAFSVSFEWDYVNVLTLLRLAGIPRYAAERTRAASAGRHRRRGDVRESRAARAVRGRDRRGRRRGARARRCAARFSAASDRADLLQRLSQERGFYIPSFYEPHYAADGTLAGYRHSSGAPFPVQKAALRTTEAVDPPVTSIFTPDTEFGSRLLIEVVRGCANLCRFCWAGYNYLPGPAISRRSDPRARRGGAALFQPCRARLDRALRSPGHRAHPQPASTRWAIRSARPRSASTI